MNRVFSRLGLTAVAIVAGSALYAQSSTTGAISGVVTDSSNNPVAGVTITATSSQVSRTIVTGADGSYRLGLLSAGSWELATSKAGLASVKQQVNVGTNATITLNLKLPKEGSTVVEVIAAGASLDPTTAQTGATLSMSDLAAVPKGRSFNDAVFLAPGTGGGGFGGSDPTIGGGSAAENSYVLDGLVTTDNRQGFQGISLVTNFIDQVEVQTGGFKPEFSALGGVVNAVTKSGSNEFRGSAWGTWDAIGIQAAPKSGDFFTAPANSSRYDVGFEVGGAFIKDKLFYFIGVDLQKLESGAFPANKYPGLVSTTATLNSTQVTAKINWQINQDQRLSVSGNYNPSKLTQDIGYLSFGTANFFGGETKNDTTTLSINYDWTITPSLFLSVKGGYTDLKTVDTPTDSTNPLVIDNHYFRVGNPAASGGPIADGPGYTAGYGGNPPGNGLPNYAGNAFNSGGYDLYRVLDQNKTKQLKADLSYFLGDHNLKFGVAYLETEYNLNQQQSGGERISVNSSASNIYIQNNHTKASVKAVYNQYYAQDTWEIVPGFRASYGIRFETQAQKDFRGNTFMKFDNFKDYAQPRLGFTWDINNDGRSKLSANYGTYFENIPQRVAIRVFANETFLRQYYFHSTGKFNYDGNNPNGYGTVVTSGGADIVADFATPFSFDPIADGTKLTQRQEYVLGYDQVLDNGFTVGIHGKHRTLKNPIEDSVITNLAGSYYDPGASSGGFGYFGQAILWNPGPTASWTARPNSGTPNQKYSVGQTYFPKAGNTYDSVDVTVDKKTAHSIMSVSYTWSRLQGNYEGVVSSSNGQADGNITASFDYYPYWGYGLLPLDRTHVIKAYGSYRFDIGKNALNVGYNWVYQSGTPISKWDNGATSTPPIPDIGGYGNNTPVDHTLGQFGRTPATNKVDAHIDYAINLGGKMRLTPSVDIFNFFNTRYATGVYQQATDQGGNLLARYGAPNGYQAGRSFRFGVKFEF